MPRRSARLAASSQAIPSNPVVNIAATESSSGASESGSPIDEDSDGQHVEPKKKRPKVAPKSSTTTPGVKFKNVRGRRGALKGIVEMPLDILHETFMYLTSADILHLSRTCKALRRLLMTKEAEYVWKQARNNLDDFPECIPDDLNEVQLAAIVFDGLCDDLTLYGQTSGAAAESASKTRMAGFSEFPTLSWVTLKIHKQHSLRSLLKKMEEQYNETLNTNVMEWDEQHDQDRYLFCHESAISIYQEYTKVPRKKRDEWVKARHLKKKRLMGDGYPFRRWLESQSEERSAQLKNVRKRRYEAIEQRLIDLERLGWERELNWDRGRTIQNLPCVKISNELTDRGWEAIKSKIFEKLEPRREQYEIEDRFAARCKRANLLNERTDEIRGKYFHKKLFPNAMKSSIRSSDGIRALMDVSLSEQVEFSDSLLLESADAWLKDR
ncbi:hypothetical protein H0H93_005110, partial [Arthromyces matolae]